MRMNSVRLRERRSADLNARHIPLVNKVIPAQKVSIRNLKMSGQMLTQNRHYQRIPPDKMS